MLKTIPVEDSQHCYQKGEQSVHRCVTAQENYFEGSVSEHIKCQIMDLLEVSNSSVENIHTNVEELIQQKG